MSNIVKNNMALLYLKSKVLCNHCMLSVIIYASETWIVITRMIIKTVNCTEEKHGKDYAKNQQRQENDKMDMEPYEDGWYHLQN